ncbi:MAG TPA: hypothetical protein VEK34_09670 [Methylocella sp.]|nr:hypothetical protein [Methylocella sp.]
MTKPKPADEPRLPVGRPTKYDPRFCAEIIEFMGQGFSKTAFAGHIGVSHDAISDWAKRYPEFSEAVKRASALRTKALEEKLLSAKTGAEVAASIFSLKNCAPHEWRDKVQVDHTVDIDFAVRPIFGGALAGADCDRVLDNEDDRRAIEGEAVAGLPSPTARP